MDQLAGKVVVITGASSGLGRATPLRFAEQGSIVIAAARREANLRETVEACQARGGLALDEQRPAVS